MHRWYSALWAMPGFDCATSCQGWQEQEERDNQAKVYQLTALSGSPKVDPEVIHSMQTPSRLVLPHESMTRGRSGRAEPLHS